MGLTITMNSSQIPTEDVVQAWTSLQQYLIDDYAGPNVGSTPDASRFGFMNAMSADRLRDMQADWNVMMLIHNRRHHCAGYYVQWNAGLEENQSVIRTPTTFWTESESVEMLGRMGYLSHRLVRELLVALGAVFGQDHSTINTYRFWQSAVQEMFSKGKIPTIRLMEQPAMLTKEQKLVNRKIKLKQETQDRRGKFCRMSWDALSALRKMSDRYRLLAETNDKRIQAGMSPVELIGNDFRAEMQSRLQSLLTLMEASPMQFSDRPNVWGDDHGEETEDEPSN